MTGTSPRLPSATTSRPASRAASITSPSARHPGAPSRSKQASCGLTATQAGPALLDQLAAVGDDRVGGSLGRIAGSAGVRGQRRGVGVEAEADLAAALGGERRQPVGERPVVAQADPPLASPPPPPPLTFFFRPEPAEKRGHLAAGDEDALARCAG